MRHAEYLGKYQIGHETLFTKDTVLHSGLSINNKGNPCFSS